MITVVDRESASVEYLTEEQGWELLSKSSQRFLHMSGREFVQRWNHSERTNLVKRSNSFTG